MCVWGWVSASVSASASVSVGVSVSVYVGECIVHSDGDGWVGGDS